MNEKDPRAKPQRPGTMLLALLIVVASGMSLVQYVSTITGFTNLSAEQQTVVSSLNWAEKGLTLFINLAVFSAAILLFLLRRSALPSFLSAFGGGMAKFGLAAFNKGSLTVVLTSGSGAGALFLGLLLAACLYTWRLDRSGVLT